MSVIFKTHPITVPQIKRINELKCILMKYGAKFAERTVDLQSDFGLIALFKTHPSNIARVEYPQLLINNIVIGVSDSLLPLNKSSYLLITIPFL